MNLDENKIQELIEKEIKEQVANKIKTIGRKTMLEIFSKASTEVIYEILEDKSYTLQKALEKELLENKEDMTQKISKRIANDITATIIEALSRRNDEDDDYDYNYDKDYGFR